MHDYVDPFLCCDAGADPIRLEERDQVAATSRSTNRKDKIHQDGAAANESIDVCHQEDHGDTCKGQVLVLPATPSAVLPPVICELNLEGSGLQQIETCFATARKPQDATSSKRTSIHSQCTLVVMLVM